METGVGRARLDGDSGDHFLSLRRALGVSSFGISQMTLKPGQRGRIHRHDRQEEVYLVISGELTVSIEDAEETLAPGELMRVAPEVRRQLINRSGETAIVVALGGDGEHQSRDAEAFNDWSESEGAPPQEVPLPR